MVRTTQFGSTGNPLVNPFACLAKIIAIQTYAKGIVISPYNNGSIEILSEIVKLDSEMYVTVTVSRNNGWNITLQRHVEMGAEPL